MRGDVKLRNAHLVVVDRGKVVDYLLNEAHPNNSGEARFFTLLGFSRDDPERLTNALAISPNMARSCTALKRSTARNMLLTGGRRRRLKRTAGGQSGPCGSSTEAGMRRGS